MKNAIELIGLLEANGHKAYLVGGCVRDRLMGMQPHDFDITTSARPDEILGVFSAYRTIPTGLKHGTVTVLADGEPYEITTFRADGEYTDHRRPDGVSFSRELKDDLCRRDFTVNAMAYNEKEGVIDLFGGQKDLNDGIIRAVGDPHKRFDEDALRILRALRFASEKDFVIEQKTKEAIFEKMHLLSFVSAERIFVELKKLIMGKGARRVLCEFSQVLGEIIPQIKPCIEFDQRNYHHIYDVYTHTAVAVESCPKDVTVRLAALLHDIGKPRTFTVKDGVGHFYGHPSVSCDIAREVLCALKCDNETKETVIKLIKYHDLVIEPSEKAVKRMLAKLGYENMERLLALKSADNLAQAPEYHSRLEGYEVIRQIVRQTLEKEECFSLKSLAVNGSDIMQLGVPAGKEVGRILNALLNLVIDGELENEREALLEKAAKII